MMQGVEIVGKGIWLEAATDFYAERLAALQAGRRPPMGIQKYLNRSLDRAFESADWGVHEGRYLSGDAWMRVTFRHQMSLGSDLIDALKVNKKEGVAQVAILAAPLSFLRIISPNDMHVLTSYEKLRLEVLALEGCLDIPLFVGKLTPSAGLPRDVEDFLTKKRPRA